MATYEDLVREVRATLTGYTLRREPTAFLSGGINSSALTITVDDASGFSPGVIEIDSECIYLRSVSGNTLTIAPDGRGWDGTTAASHSANARVTMSPPFPTWRLARAINDTIVGTWPDLYGVGTTSFTYNPSVTTYSLPAEVENVLSVTATMLGPSQEQAEIHEYKFNSNAPTSEFATGNCITLLRVPEPGRTVTVTYAKAPSEISAGDALTESGLRETARRSLVYGALAQLVSLIDSARVTTDSAVADEFDTAQRVGTATQMAAQLTARYQMELEQEKRRLRQAHGPKIRFTGR